MDSDTDSNSDAGSTSGSTDSKELLNEGNYKSLAKLEKKIKENENEKKKMHFFDILDLVLREDQLLRPNFQDISPSFDDEVPFLVDGDSLMITLLTDKNWSAEFGGSSLHLIYLFERYLDIFKQRGGKFYLVFFQTWRNIWHINWSILLHRLIIMNHFAKNTQYPVLMFDHCFDDRFLELIYAVRPGFILTNMTAYADCCKFKIQRKLLQDVVNIHFLQWLQLDLPCIHTDVQEDVSVIKGFYLDCNSEVRGIIGKYYHRFMTFIAKELPIIKDIKLPENLEIVNNCDIRKVVYLYAVYFYYKRNTDKNMVKIFLLKLALMEFLQLKNRCCPKLSNSFSELDRILAEWFKCMYFACTTLENGSYDFKIISDLWHGFLFANVCHFVSAPICSCDELGDELSTIYNNLIQDFNNFGFSLDAYPILLSNTNIKFEPISLVTTEQKELQPLVSFQNPLFLKFCDGILDNIKWYDFPTNLREKQYKEEHHYHNMKVMKDECDRIKDTIVKRSSDKKQQKKIITNRNKHARYMNIYGSSIEGRPLEVSGVVRNNKKSAKKKQKTSKKAQEIIETNNKSKFVEQEKKAQQKFQELKTQYKLFNRDLKTLLESVNLVLNNKIINEGSSYFTETLFLKLKVLNALLKNNSKCEDKTETKKSIFLISRQILLSCVDISDKKKILLSKSLGRINCSEIAKRNNLPTEEEPVEDNDNWIRFQLKELGSELIRESDGKPDSRITGFIPDKWQSDLFDIVDQRQSALIVAPTSSGKTYASYYCMESVLREGTEGVVVYVSPTKALVNQVAATVYARFKDTVMPEGSSVYGIFTRDYKTYVNNSQILVTVPQAFEILLLSPRRHTWLKRLRYVIFDEIHCIEGQVGGASFERCLLLINCPFLALSATIRHPDAFHHWLQKIENYKYFCDEQNGFPRKKDSNKVHIVKHLERHSDLIKYTYDNGVLHHLHPYAELEPSVLHQHQGIPSHLTLSPAETLQLYDAMYTVYNQSQQLHQLKPVIFFSSHLRNGFISKNLVKQYALELSLLLKNWYEHHNQQFLETINILKPDTIDCIDETGNNYITHNIANLVIHLKQQNMLPAIVFSYNRSLVKDMTVSLTDYFEETQKIAKPNKNNINKQNENAPLVKPVVDHWETKKYKQKAFNAYSGNHENVLDTIDFKMCKEDRRNLPKHIPNWQRVHKPLNLICENGEQTLQGVGTMNSEDMEFIEEQLRKGGVNSKHFVAKAIRNGFCLHHGGVRTKVRHSVEILFRKRFLNVIFATGTLALGIHVPCKTTIIAGNSGFLNSLEYQQTSGRAGRRGFDNEGNVIFFGLNKRKQHSLLTAHLPNLKGNFPISVTLILRSLLLVSDVTDNGKETEEAKKISVSRIMTMFENSLCYESSPDLKINIKHFFSYSLQLLKIHDFINEKGEPLKWCGLATHLHYFEPGNLAFIYLLRTGIIRELCTSIKDHIQLHYTLMLILCHLFTDVPLNATSKNKKFNYSAVILDPIPEIVYKALKEYNSEVRFVYNQYLANVANYFNDADNILPLSAVRLDGNKSVQITEKKNLQNNFLNMCTPKSVCSSFAALSGNDDENAYSEESLISNLKQKMSTNKKVIPLVNLNRKLNAYALNFFNHGLIKSIVDENEIKEGEEFTLITDFLLVLKTIRVSLEEMAVKDENDIIYTHFKYLEERYESLHLKAFGRGHY